jgi:hypothetical protein
MFAFPLFFILLSMIWPFFLPCILAPVAGIVGVRQSLCLAYRPRRLPFCLYCLLILAVFCIPAFCYPAFFHLSLQNLYKSAAGGFTSAAARPCCSRICCPRSRRLRRPTRVCRTYYER